MRQINLPEEKLNELAQEVSARLAARHFFDQGVVRGEELKSFAEHKQINRFLLFQVFQVWEIQINKLNHPYFDLEQKDVQNTVQALKNQISQHIRIREEDFMPLLKRAVYNNLKLILTPKETFESFFFAQTDKIPLNTYERYAQFFSDLDFIVNSILRYFQKNGMAQVEKDLFFLKMEKAVDVFNRKSPEPFDAYRNQLFRQLTGKDIDSILNEAQRLLEAKERMKRQQEEEEKRRIEEERRKAEEAKRKKEEEARRKAEEEARRKAEEKRLKTSFFDTLSTEGNFFDLDDDDASQNQTQEEQAAPGAFETEEKKVAPPKQEPIIPEPKPEIPPTSRVESVFSRPEPVEPKPEPKIEPKPEVQLPKEPKVEPTFSQPVQETPAEEIPQPKVQKEEPAKPSYIWKPVEEVTEKPKVEEEKPERKKIVIPKNKASKTSSTNLDKFKQETPAVEEEEVNRPASVFDKINEGRKPTVVEQFGSKTESSQVHDNLNGNRKIKLDEIPIHKQYQYVQKVFDGNNVRFRIIVDKINNAENQNEVEEILDKFVLSNQNLNQGDSVVQEFIKLLRNRF